MFSIVLGVAAVASTVMRSWPQFLRVMRRETVGGVSSLTWGLMLANHSAWTTYGVLTENPVLIIANALAAIGCLAIVSSLKSWRLTLVVCLGATAATLALHGIHNGLVLPVIVTISLSMFVPQMIKTFNAPPEGVSVAAWAVSTLSSVIWITWAASIGHVALATAHFFMGPVAAVIAIRTYFAHSRKHPVTAPAVDIDEPVAAGP